MLRKRAAGGETDMTNILSGRSAAWVNRHVAYSGGLVPETFFEVRRASDYKTVASHVR